MVLHVFTDDGVNVWNLLQTEGQGSAVVHFFHRHVLDDPGEKRVDGVRDTAQPVMLLLGNDTVKAVQKGLQCDGNGRQTHGTIYWSLPDLAEETVMEGLKVGHKGAGGAHCMRKAAVHWQSHIDALQGFAYNAAEAARGRRVRLPWAHDDCGQPGRATVHEAFPSAVVHEHLTHGLCHAVGVQGHLLGGVRHWHLLRLTKGSSRGREDKAHQRAPWLRPPSTGIQEQPCAVKVYPHAEVEVLLSLPAHDAC
mmetsp:Transcript_1675/g.3939  ORF Transcript_1675/g.3939 Transcript_1675/m.3939 type:complete len:251 (-) Transcript_1675:335-1087(-)